MSARYAFDFISAYGGVADYRIYRDGKDAGRVSVNQNNECYYSDKSGMYTPELNAFNEYKKAEHERAVAKWGVENVGPWIPYVSA